MNLYLDTSAFKAVLKLDDKTYEADLGHEMAENHKTWTDIKKITYYSGPGSFTGLRIGASLVNTLAHELEVPLYDHYGKLHKIILPDYGRPARITSPKK